ncbi:hypothetical protein MSPP1_000184 [Malassezia sp. CBS 17886]|nr:hypothetical protein MSPP1_000184 [Malassezia sp. CBS 17886]
MTGAWCRQRGAKAALSQRRPVLRTAGHHRLLATSARAGEAREKDKPTLEHRVQYNRDLFSLHPPEEHLEFPLVDAAALSRSKERPRGVRMLTRDFIYDSLYNPHYGYFSRQAVLLPDDRPADEKRERMHGHFAFGEMRNEKEFMRAVQLRYTEFEERYQREREEREKKQARGPTRTERIRELDRKQRMARWGSAEAMDLARDKGRLQAEESTNSMTESEVDIMAAGQVWHTPTQLFSPYYGQALARYLVAEYKLRLFPYHDLVVYELGGGAGTLARDILDYIEEVEPEVYPRMRYNIVEISARLAKQQRKRLARHADHGVANVVHRDFVQWDEDVSEPCFVVALEVLDNLAHDVVRYSTADFRPYQGLVSIDRTGDMQELYEPVQDPVIRRYLQLLASVRPSVLPPSAPLYLGWMPESVRRMLQESAPFYPNLTPPHYVPTGMLQLMDVLKKHFPLHRLVLSDFSSLPDAMEGTNAPVVQTRHAGTMIPVTTYCVLQGFFDIFFPTNFDALRAVYLAVMGAPPVSHAPLTGHGSELPSTYFTPLDPTQLGCAEPGLPRYQVPSSVHEDYSLSPGRFFSSDLIPPPLLPESREARIFSHAEFLQRYADTNKTELRDGSNPLLSWYANACWFLT